MALDGKEKLVFSMQDLGRLAAFMDDHPGKPIDLVKEWIGQYSRDADECTVMFSEIQEGYILEQAYPYDGH